MLVMFRVIPEGLAFREHVLLKDGQGLLLRPAVAADVPLVEAFTHRVSRESLRLRFMASMSEVPRATVEGLCSGDFGDRGCLLAMVVEDDGDRVVGLGNYVGVGDGRTAEVAFLVEDEFQGRGISSLILERLAGIAAAKGYVEMNAEVLPENQAMMKVLTDSGFVVHRVWGADSVHVELPVSGGAAQRERAELRERLAVANSLAPMLRPPWTSGNAAAARQPALRPISCHGRARSSWRKSLLTHGRCVRNAMPTRPCPSGIVSSMEMCDACSCCGTRPALATALVRAVPSSARRMVVLEKFPLCTAASHTRW